MAILVLGALAGLGVMRRNNMMGVEKVSPFTQDAATQGAMETQMLEQEDSVAEGTSASNHEWEENGVRWLRQEDGSLFYLDPQANQWVPFQQTE